MFLTARKFLVLGTHHIRKIEYRISNIEYGLGGGGPRKPRRGPSRIKVVYKWYTSRIQVVYKWYLIVI